MSTFVEFNKCWTSGKRSRLFIESVNGNAFMNFSVFLGHPGNVYFDPKNHHTAKKKVKSKRKTDRDNERAAKFQERKKKEMEAAASAAATDSSGGLPQNQNTSSRATQTSSSLEFSFAEPALESTNSDTSNFATMNMDGNVTIPSKACEKSALPPKLNKEVQCLPQGVCDAQIQTDKLVISNDEREWFDTTDWFKANKHKVKPGIRQHAVQCIFSEEKDLVDKFYQRHLSRGVSKDEIEDLWNSNYSEDLVLLEEY